MNIFYKILGLACLLLVSASLQAQTLPPAQFTWAPDTGCVGQPVVFTDSTQGVAAGYHLWSFGDGTTAFTGAPIFVVTHVYTAPGNYNVYMCVYDSLANDTTCTTHQIIVQNCGPVTPLAANFGLQDTICLTGPTALIQPWDSTTGGTWPLSYSWTLSNGAQSTSMNPSFPIQTPGTYTLTLCVTDGNNTTSCKTRTVVVTACNAPPLSVNFVAPDTACFWNTQTLWIPGSASGGLGSYSYSWSATNGANPITTTGPSTAVVFPGPGTYNLELCVIDNILGDTACFDKNIVMLGGSCGPPLMTMFGWWPSPACINVPVQFWDSTTGGSFSYQYTWDFGDGTTSTSASPSHSYTTPGTYTVTLCAIDTALNDTACSSQSIQVNQRCGPKVNVGSVWASKDTVCPGQIVQFYDSTSGGSQGLIFDWDFGDGNSSGQQQPSHSYLGPGNFTVTLCVYDTVSYDTSCASVTVIVLSTCTDTISGYVFHDVNGNSNYDAGDTPLSGQSVAIYPGPAYVFTNAAGFYEMPAAPGPYVVVAPVVTGYGNTSPSTGSYNHSLIGSSTRYSGDFGYDSLLSQHDLKIYMYCSRPRPGFSKWISLYYRNQGTTPVTATLTLTYDPLLNFTHTVPANSGVHNATNNTVTWTFPNLQPGAISSRVRAWFTVPANATLGQLVTSTVTITPLQGDIDISNNDDYCTRPVTNSYDPNDKRVRPGEGPEGYIDGDERLTYNIRFQNTGTDTAFTVIVKDKIDPNLDLSTFQMHGSSHAYSLTIDKNREAAWTFNNILLPDSNTNEPASHGHIQYSIEPKPGLQPGQRIENTAAIYFDFNPAIITNTTVNTIRSATALDADLVFDQFEVFPNPSQGFVTLRFANPLQQSHSLRLMDIQGKEVQRHSTHEGEFRVDLSQQPKGVYFYQLQAEDGRKLMGRLIKI